MTYTFTVDECWLGRWRGPSRLAVDTRFRFADAADPEPIGHLPGTVLPGFRDAHVHLGLIDHGALVSGGITAVVDLGGDVNRFAEMAAQATMPEISFAGQMLTAPGGYPSQASWAHPALWREVSSPGAAKSAVAAQLTAGASVIKLALNSDAGPVLDTSTLWALVAHAHARGIRVIAHVQGVGQAERALDAGVDGFAHTPWSERLDDKLIAAMARSQTWISTLDIHGWGEDAADPGSAGSSGGVVNPDRAVAHDNLRRFHAAGGRIHYGTDLGNGPLPVGINPRELRALRAVGLSTDALVAAVAPEQFGARLSYLPEANTGDGADWLAGAVALSPSDLADVLNQRTTQMAVATSAAERDEADPLAHFRDRFVLDGDVIAYLDGNSLGRPTKASAIRLAEFVTAGWGGRLIRGWDEAWYDMPIAVGDAIGAATLGAAPGQTFVGDSTTVILYKLIRAAISARPGRHEIVVDTDNFPTDRFLLQGIAAECGMTLRWIHPEPDAGVTPEQVAEVVGEDTALVVLSHVAYRSGYLADAPAITALAHEAGALVLWDLCHSVGVVPTELDAWGVDLAAGCTYKYLNGGPGSPAFGYVRAGLHDELEQPIQGWMGTSDPFAMGPEYAPHRGIRRFISGTPAIGGMLAMRDMLELVAEAGLPQIRRKSEQLTAFAVELADTLLVPLGARIASPRDPERRGSHITVDHDAFAGITSRLWAAGIIPDFRHPNGLRLGLSPLTTSFAELQLGVEAIARELRVELGDDSESPPVSSRR